MLRGKDDVRPRMIALTLWVVIFPRSGLTWRVFPDLPTPPADLVGRLPGRESGDRWLPWRKEAFIEYP